MRLLGGLIALVLCLTLSSIGMAAEVGDILKARDGRFKLEVMGDTSLWSMELDGSVEVFSITSTTADADPDDIDNWKTDANGWEVSNNFVITNFGLGVLDTYSRRLDKLDETITMESLLFKFTFALTNGLAVYLKAGQGRIKTDSDHAEGTVNETGRSYDAGTGIYNNTDRDITTNVYNLNGGRGGYGMAYGVGVRYYFIEQDSFNAGLDAQYNHLESDDVWESKWTNIVYSYDEGEETDRREWQRKFKVDDAIADEFQIALLARKTIGDLSAYGGLKYTYLTINYEGSYEASLNRADYDENISKRYSVKKDFDYDSKPDGLPLGLFFGADYKLTKSIGTKFEVRLLDEFAVSSGLYYTF